MGQWQRRHIRVARTVAAIALGMGGTGGMLGAAIALDGAAIAQATEPATEPATGLSVAADAAFDADDYGRAADLYERWLPTADAAAADYEKSLIQWGQALLKLERYGDAVPVIERSLMVDGRPPVLGRLGLALFHLGRYDRAIAVIDQALDRWEELRQDEFDDLDRVTLLEQQGYLYRLLLRSLVAAGRTDEALVAAERGRARSLVELLARRAEGAPLSAAPPTLDRLRAVARSLDATLVSYAVIGREAKVFGDEPEDDSLWGVWVVRPSGAVTFRKIDLEPVTEAGEEASFVPLVTAARQDATFVLPQATYAGLRALYDRAIAPIDDLLPRDERETVVFALQGALYLAPWAALQGPDGRFLIDRFPIATVPSLQTLDATVQLHRQPSRATKPGLAIGNPVSMPSLPTGPNGNLEPLDPLQGAEAEAREVADLLGGQLLLNEAATKPRVLDAMQGQRVLHFATHGLLDRDEELNEYGLPWDAAATTARQEGLQVTPGSMTLGEAGKPVQMVLSNGGSMRITADGIIIDGNVSVNDKPARVVLARERMVRPLMPGTIALAPSGGDDGLLRSLEIAQEPLAADLAVLSACDTGRGRITGDGVVGVARSFMAAGVPTVVASLWRVPDEPTRQLMVAFYGHWLAGMPKAAALRQAMLDTRAQFPLPRDWSAFLVIGTPE